MHIRSALRRLAYPVFAEPSTASLTTSAGLELGLF